MARYFAVSTDAVHSIVRRHREELQTNGLTTLKGPDLHSFELVILTSSKDGAPESYPQGRAHLRLYTRRTVLNIAMLLRDSEVARRVRTYLLDAEESRPAVAVFDPRYDGIDRRVTDLESAMGEVGPVLRELGPVLTRMSHRLEAMDRRLDATNRVLGAMSVRLSDVIQDVAEIKRALPPVPRQRRGSRRR